MRHSWHPRYESYLICGGNNLLATVFCFRVEELQGWIRGYLGSCDAQQGFQGIGFLPQMPCLDQATSALDCCFWGGSFAAKRACCQ
jgi:hypothetical protein